MFLMLSDMKKLTEYHNFVIRKQHILIIKKIQNCTLFYDQLYQNLEYLCPDLLNILCFSRRYQSILTAKP